MSSCRVRRTWAGRAWGARQRAATPRSAAWATITRHSWRGPLQGAGAQVRQPALLGGSEQPYQDQREHQVEHARGDERLEGKIELGVDEARRAGDVEQRHEARERAHV